MYRKTSQSHRARTAVASALRVAFLSVLALALVAGLFTSAALADTFTLLPGSPSLPLIPAGPADLLWDVPGIPAPGFPPPPSVGVPFGLGGMGLGPLDVVDAISDGMDPVFITHTDYFSVTAASVGAPGSGVAAEVAGDTPPGLTPGHAGDIFVSGPLLAGTNILAPAGFGWTLGSTTGDEFNAGLITPTPPLAPGGDDVNAYDLATIAGPAAGMPVFFSLAAGSPTLAGLFATPADILAVGGPFGPVPVIFLPALALGLPAGAVFEMDALAFMLSPVGGFGGPGSIEYSLDPVSAAILGVSPADILGVGPGPVPIIVHTAASIGLLPSDDVDALDVDQRIVPEPGSVVMFGLGAVALVGLAWRRRKQSA